MSDEIKPEPFAGVDRSATPESLQHVAAPTDVEQAIRQGIEKIRATEDRPDWPGPATSADLLELDAVPEPADSDAPREVHQAGAASAPAETQRVCLGPRCARGPSDCWTAGRCLVEEP